MLAAGCPSKAAHHLFWSDQESWVVSVKDAIDVHFNNIEFCADQLFLSSCQKLHHTSFSDLSNARELNLSVD